MVAGAVVSAVVASALEEKTAAVVAAHTAFFDVRGGEEVAAAAFAAVASLAVASLAVAAAGCGWCLHLVVVVENSRNTH